MTILEQLEPVKLVQQIVKRDQAQQKIVSPRTELTRLHDPRNRRLHVNNERRRAAAHIRDDCRDRIFRRSQIIETRRRVAVVTIGKDHLVQLCVIDNWHFFGLLSLREKLGGR
jgi:hypothetical protein